MFTRTQYMDNQCTHQEYYIQFATSGIKAFVERNYTPEYIRSCYEQDKHLNNLGNGWIKQFDSITRCLSGEIAGVNKKLNGEATYSLSDGTSAIKAYMKAYAKVA